MFALRYRGGQKGRRGRRPFPEKERKSEGPCGSLRWNEKEREGGGWVNSGLRQFCNPVEASRGEKGIGSAAVEDEKERGASERVSELDEGEA